MGYRINIALNGQHFFATDADALNSEYRAKQVLKELVKRFPEYEGYSITIARQETVSRYESLAEFIQDLRG